MGSQPRINNHIDSLRLVLALAVIWSHSFALGAGSEEREPVSLLTAGQVNAGNVAVFFFFAISGYLITESWLRAPRATSFLKKRVARIYPGFLGAIACSVVVFVPLGLHRLPGAVEGTPWRSVFLEALRLQHFTVPGTFVENASQAVNGSLWSISYEFWCYIGVLLLGLLGGLTRPALLWLVLVLTVFANEVLVRSGWLPGGMILGSIFGAPFLWTRLLPYFLAGMILRLCKRWLPLRPWPALGCLAALLVLRFVPRGINIGLPFLGTYALMWMGLAERGRLPSLARFGDLSYGTYLYAFPIEQIVVMEMGGKANPLLVFAIAVPLTLCAAVASWHLIEKPALAWAGKRGRGEPAPAIPQGKSAPPLQP